jgi:peroxiredoxin
MVSIHRILLGSFAAFVGAILACSFYARMIHPLLAAPRPAPAASATTSATVDPEVPDAGTPAPAVSSGAAADAEQEFMALAQHLKAALKETANSKPAAQEAIASLQAFIAKHPRAPITDKVYLSLGNMSLAVGDTDGAIAAYEHVARTPNDPSLGPVGTLFLGKAQAQAGRVDEARVLLQKLIDQEKGSSVGQAAAAAIRRLAMMPGQRPPAFLMKDLDGHIQSPDRYRGKVLLIDFWATWCGPCREELPNIKKVYAQYKDRGFAILGVSLDADRDALKECLQEEGITWPQLCDGRGPHGEIASQMGITSIPAMVLLDKEGVIRFVDTRGPLLEQAVGALLMK